MGWLPDSWRRIRGCSCSVAWRRRFCWIVGWVLPAAGSELVKGDIFVKRVASLPWLATNSWTTGEGSFGVWRSSRRPSWGWAWLGATGWDWAGARSEWGSGVSLAADLQLLIWSKQDEQRCSKAVTRIVFTLVASPLSFWRRADP